MKPNRKEKYTARKQPALRFRPVVEQLETRAVLSAAFPDFNGDGFDDLAIGVPFDEVQGVTNAGAVNVIYGSSRGLTIDGNQLWSQAAAGMRDVPEANDNFGAALTWGDFNGDGYDDLAVGIPGEDVLGITNAGAVAIIYGSRFGLVSDGNQFLHQEYGSIQDGADANDQFGFSLTAGDYNGDGFADLAVGVPFEDVNGVNNAGAVNIIYGSSVRLQPVATEFLYQGSGRITDRAEANDQFGYSLATGYFNADGFADLAVGVPLEDIRRQNAGAVHVIYGNSLRLNAGPTQMWYQGAGGLRDSPEVGDQFGFDIVAGDFNADGIDDLAVGIPLEDIGRVVNAGAVQIIYGASLRLTGSRNQFWYQGRNGILDPAEAGDQFGTTLAAGDFNGDGRDDLAVGVPLEDISGVIDAGAINIIYGSRSGLTGSGNQFWHQNSPGVEEQNETSDQFGFCLAAGDYNRDGRADLAISIPFEDIGADVNCGAVIVFYGPFGAIVNDQLWWQDFPGLAGDARTGDNFGRALVRR